MVDPFITIRQAPDKCGSDVLYYSCTITRLTEPCKLYNNCPLDRRLKFDSDQKPRSLT